MKLVIRPFAPEEWQLYKATRLKALQANPGVFGRSYAYEAAFPDDEWRARLMDPNAAMFGVFENGALIGLTGVYIPPEDPQIAYFMADWLEPAARGRGLSAKMHEARTVWAKARPGITRLNISYRADNAIAKHAGEKFGFNFTHAEEFVWPDGATVPLHHYEMLLEQKKSILNDNITMRRFKPDEWLIFKEIRLKALQTDPSVYSSTYEEMIREPDTYWRDRLKNPQQAIFGAFHEGTLIGMTGVYIRDKESGQAWLGSSWLEKEWRNKGISMMLFEARLTWVRQQPALSTLLVAHRENNISSMKAILKHGFQLDHTDSVAWPDGKTEPELTYKLELGA